MYLKYFPVLLISSLTSLFLTNPCYSPDFISDQLIFIGVFMH